MQELLLSDMVNLQEITLQYRELDLQQEADIELGFVGAGDRDQVVDPSLSIEYGTSTPFKMRPLLKMRRLF